MLPIIRHSSLSKNNRWTWDIKELPTSEVASSIFSNALESIKSTKMVDSLDTYPDRFLFTCTISDNISETKFDFCIWLDEEKGLFVAETYRLDGDYDLYKYCHQYLLEHAQQSFHVKPSPQYTFLKSIQTQF